MKTKTEKEIQDSYEAGKWKSVKNIAIHKKRLATVARETLKKNKVITIRLPERDLVRIKARAAQEGMPYQTYISSLIHKDI